MYRSKLIWAFAILAVVILGLAFWGMTKQKESASSPGQATPAPLSSPGAGGRGEPGTAPTPQR